jgi:hypothetical protein
MTEHRRYADLAAMAIDFTLDAMDADDLRRHLDGCTACRRLSDAMRADAAAMRSIDFGPAPVIVRERVAALALKGQPDSPRLLLLVATGLLLLLAVFAGSAAVGAFLQQRQVVPDLPRMGQIQWRTEVVDLRAADLWIEFNGQRFSPQGAQVAVASAPTADMLSLETSWQENGREMRLGFFFGADETSWWVNGIQAWDGRVEADWAATKGMFFRSPHGRVWTGNVDIPLEDVGNGAGAGVRVHIEGLQLSIAPNATVVQPNGAASKRANDMLFAAGGPLHCSGIFQMTPAEAHQVLLKLGYAVSWRLVTPGFSDVRTTPPEGVIFDAGSGTSGEVIMFVANARDLGQVADPKIDFAACPNLNPAPVPRS